MPTEKELMAAQKLALFHDKIRRDVTASLRWALDTFELFKERIPKDPALAEQCHRAMRNLRTSENLTSSTQPL